MAGQLPKDVEDTTGDAVAAGPWRCRPQRSPQLGQHGELGCKPAQVITARHEATKSTAKGTEKEGEAALTKIETDAVRQGAPGSGPWGARVASRQGRP